MAYETIRSVATSAALQAGERLLSKLDRIDRIDKKGAIDLVTDADIASEKCIIEAIRRVFPNDTILSEESGAIPGSSEGRWIVDPLDGTTNFAHGVGLFAVSIAYAIGGDVLVGIVLNPVTREFFSAVKGQGAQLNGRAIHVSKTPAVADSLLVTGFPYNFKTILNSVIRRFSNCLEASQGVRRLGSAAVDLCYVACGRFEAFWEENLQPWDTAAGMLIVQEAGGKVSTFNGSAYDFFGAKEILASNGLIHNEMATLLRLKENDEVSGG
jgi:myo-inositol-1(or 4)-monophosphatase